MLHNSLIKGAIRKEAVAQKCLLVRGAVFTGSLRKGITTHLPHSLHPGQSACFHGDGEVVYESMSWTSVEAGESSMQGGESNDDQVINKKHSAKPESASRRKVPARRVRAPSSALGFSLLYAPYQQEAPEKGLK